MRIGLSPYEMEVLGSGRFVFIYIFNHCSCRPCIALEKIRKSIFGSIYWHLIRREWPLDSFNSLQPLFFTSSRRRRLSRQRSPIKHPLGMARRGRPEKEGVNPFSSPNLDRKKWCQICRARCKHPPPIKSSKTKRVPCRLIRTTRQASWIRRASL